MSNIMPGQILAQEEVKSSSSNNVYTVTLYDNCISCTCPAGNKKEYCKHMQKIIYNNHEFLKKVNEEFYNKTFIFRDYLYGHCKKIGEYLLLADELIYIADKDTAEQAHINILSAIEKHKQKLNELIDSIESLYSKEQQKEILEYFWKAEKNSYIPDSPLLFDLVKNGFIKISEKKHIKYRLEKYFTANNITSISEKKEFIFNQLPDSKGLKRGKNTSYDDVEEFILTNYFELFDEVLKDFKTYDFGDIIGENGHLLALYFYRAVGNGSNYKFNYKKEEYELKNDEITQIMQERGYNFVKPTNDPRVVTINVNLSDTINKCNKKYYTEHLKQIGLFWFETLFKKNRPIWLTIIYAILFIAFLPYVLLFTIIKLLINKKNF